MVLNYILFPAIGCAVGTLTNYIAIKLLFRPRRKIFGIQGLLPKRKNEIAERTGVLINDYLVNVEEIRKKIDRNKIEEALERYLNNIKYPIINIPGIKYTLKMIGITILVDRDGYIKRKIVKNILHDEMIADIVRKKITEFDLVTLERLIKRASGPELRFIIFTGGILGFIIGLIESFLI